MNIIDIFKTPLFTCNLDSTRHMVPKLEKYVGRYIKGDLGGVKVSNPSYVKYYKDLIK